MGRSYRQCTECGKRALSIATRCPGCGHELSATILTDPRPPLKLERFLRLKLLAGVVATAGVLGAVVFSQGSRVPEEQSVLAAIAPAAPSEVAFSEDTIAEPSGELLVARTWTHVRATRRVNGDVEAVLLPGDTVLADSLSRGWYRVALEGEVLGYAHRSTLVDPAREAAFGRSAATPASR